MKTQYSHRPRRISSGGRVVAFIVVLIIVIGFLLRIFAPGVFVTILSPLLSFGNYVAGIVTTATDAPITDAELVALRAETETLRNENDTLRARLADIGSTETAPGVLAGVIARPPLSPYDTLIVEVPETGVSEGAFVFHKGVPVGTIARVDGRYAHASLFSTSGRVTGGWAGEERLPISLMGSGAGSFTADVPRELPIAEGATIYLPGPGAYPAGTVRKIESHASSPRATLHIDPLVNPFSITWVRIVSP